ncbi:MAG: Fic family protein, partial [Phycisphaerales bacterium]
YKSERVHYVCPKPEHVETLMGGLIAAHRLIEQSAVHPVVHASIVGYAFVFVHPFEDGNGRIHRLLIHNILTRRGFAPPGVIFPVSAAMLRQPGAYDASLEAFSGPILGLVEYSIDDEGRMEVHNDADAWYRYPDMTAQTESLFGFVEQTIETELVEELAFLSNYDRVKQAMQEIVDMPDREIDLFIRYCLQNNGKLSQRKRQSRFAELADDEVDRLEAAVASGRWSEPVARDRGF